MAVMPDKLFLTLQVFAWPYRVPCIFALSLGHRGFLFLYLLPHQVTGDYILHLNMKLLKIQIF